MKKKRKKKKSLTGRRYSKSEKKQILEDSKTKTLAQLYDIYGVVPETIRRWKKREKTLEGSLHEVLRPYQKSNCFIFLRLF